MNPTTHKIAASFRKAQNAEAQLWMGEVLSILRAQSWNYQTSHWQSMHLTSYADHLMFERMYNAIPEEVDGLAEKMVGYFGPDAVEPVVSMDKTHGWVVGWSRTANLFDRALQSEADLQKACQMAYDSIKKSGGMTLGLDDFLMALANAHETNQYLLRQKVGRHE